SGLVDEDMDLLPHGVEFVTRPNFGYDFYSYKWGLDLVPDYPDYDRVVVSNDSFVGPSVPLHQITESRRAHEVDLMGMTHSFSYGGHVQSFFFTAKQELTRSRGFRNFWKYMEPVSDRTRVIHEYEIGLSRAVENAGFSIGGYFVPTDTELALARSRFRHYADVRPHVKEPDKYMSEVLEWDGDRTLNFNPACALADRFLVDDRLPLLKFDTLRYDPYELGAERLLSTAEATRPDLLEGVRDFLTATKPKYPFRPGENNIVVSERSLRASGLGYCLDPAFAGREIGLSPETTHVAETPSRPATARQNATGDTQ
ncbi:rhamnan synthesis F family protein, partial [Brevibacterium litoralis]|uniref:rhamnan synthesis F family protein n=1 Tax=Brevibacterium litoralis TaxID=3138935 RepID=UPI0032EE2D18